MRKIFGLVVLLSILSSCNLNGSTDKYTITGTIKNHPAKSVLLEKLSLKAIIAVDSAKIDDKGGFKMEGISEKGFYRLKLDDKTFFLFLLEPAKYLVTIDVQNPEPSKIVGPPDNDEFQSAMKQIGTAQRELQNWNMTYQMFSHNGTSQDTLAFVQQQLQMAAVKMETLVKDSAKAAKSPLVAMFYVTNVQIDKFPKENLAVVQRLEKEMPTSSYTKDFREIYDNYSKQLAQQQDASKQVAENVAIGKPAPDIDLKNPEGKNIKLSSLKGKVVLLDFWASWCGPCRMEMPNVVAAYKKYKDKGFTVYSVSLDKDATAWKNAIGTLGMTWENHVSDLKWWQSEVVPRYGIQGIPAAYLLDRNGIIIAANLRGEALDQKIAEVIK